MKTDRHTAATSDSSTRSPDADTGSSVPILQTRAWQGFLAVAAVGMVWQWIQLVRDQPAPVVPEREPEFLQNFQVDINQADWVEFIQLEGIGQRLAHRITADRRINGPFASIDDLSRVPGIGPKTLDHLRQWLTISHDTEPAPHGNDTERIVGNDE